AELGDLLDLLKERFPAAPGPLNWYDARMEAYRGVKDEAGARALLRTRIDALKRSADAGNVRSMNEYMAYDPNLSGQGATTAEVGGYWMAYADKFKDTRLELYCLRQARDAYFTTPLRNPKLEREVMVEKALEAVARLQAQPMDPEVRWNMLFDDVNLLLELARHPKQEARLLEALKRIDERLKGNTDIRDLRLRLGFGGLAAATEKNPNQARRVVELLKRLRRICTGGDLGALNGTEARMCFLLGAYGQAEKMYMKFFDDAACPLAGYWSFRAALECSRHISAGRMQGTFDRLVPRIRQWQDTVPGLLYELGRHLLAAKHAGFLGVRKALADKYPASKARGQLEALYARTVGKK
ncbi:MAG TPA: hypothetical protein VFJ30_15420, partial [Phycisphaerae bacterium]|nr:hypothetical protein [Phycisphaerae bacterium]